MGLKFLGNMRKYNKHSKNEYNKRWNANNLDKVRESRKRYNIKRKSRNIVGVCCQCRKEQVINGRTRCRLCWIKDTTRRYLGSINHAPLLVDKYFQQDGLCFYSGVKLKIGDGASVDHRIAKANGGTNEINNLQWVHTIVNKMKLNLTEQEFAEWISQIYHHWAKSFIESRNVDKTPTC